MKVYNFYKIVDDKNKVIYIGCTGQNPSKRLMQHRKDLNSAIQKNHIQNINLVVIPILFFNGKEYTNVIPYPLALRTEEFLTYVYGFKYNLVNEYAGNQPYEDNNEHLRYEKVFMFIQAIESNQYMIEVNAQKELMDCLMSIYPYDSFSLEKLQDYCYEKMSGF